MYLQGVDNVYELQWNRAMTYGDVHHRTEYEFSTYNFEVADTEKLLRWFEDYEKECQAILSFEKPLVHPAYDYLLKCSHTFNLLDARGAISVSQRVEYIARIRHLAQAIAEKYLEVRESLGFPLLEQSDKKTTKQKALK